VDSDNSLMNIVARPYVAEIVEFTHCRHLFSFIILLLNQ
jgi:hypothetical protein